MAERFDAELAPHDDLLEMRRLTAGFARILADTSDAELRACAHKRSVVAEVALAGRLLALKARALRVALTDEERDFEADVPYTATLPIGALRSLFEHSAIHLNVELRDLKNDHWTGAQDIPKNRATALRDAILECRSGAGS